MADGKRPGGLTALAVLNFVFAGLGILAVLALFAMIGVIEHAGKGAEFHHALAEKHVGAGVLYGGIMFALVRMGLMIAAGVGYLGQKRGLGRTVGNIYAVLALLDTAYELGVTQTGFTIGTLIGLVYPVLTLILINTTFKDDLVN